MEIAPGQIPGGSRGGVVFGIIELPEDGGEWRASRDCFKGGKKRWGGFDTRPEKLFID